ncbi:MAG: hypothetical protein ACFB9M_08910 [Myxococcota bacterium]
MFGPVTAREILELLYEGSLGFDAQIAPEGRDFHAVSRYEVFQAHHSRVQAQLSRQAELQRRLKAEARVRRQRQLRWLVGALVVLALGGFGLRQWIRMQRVSAAEALREQQEAQLAAEIEALYASVSIEPPLMPVKGPVDVPSRRTKRRQRRTPSSVKAPSGPPSDGAVIGRLGRVVPRFKRCIIEQIQRAPDTVGAQITLSFAIDNDGRPGNIDIHDRFLRRSELLPCMRAALQQVRWAPYSGEVRNVEYPIRIGRS